jgi:hypothetical protein
MENKNVDNLLCIAIFKLWVPNIAKLAETLWVHGVEISRIARGCSWG